MYLRIGLGTVININWQFEKNIECIGMHFYNKKACMTDIIQFILLQNIGFLCDRNSSDFLNSVM